MKTIMLKAICIVSSLWFVTAGCAVPVKPAVVSQKPFVPIKIMAIGDSITAGKGYSWRYHLWKKLREVGYNFDFVGDSQNQPYKGNFDMDHEGHGGATTDQVAKYAAPAIVKHQPDVVLIHLGTNDYISEKEKAEVNAAEIGGIIDQLRAANPKVIVFLAQISFVSDEYRKAVADLATQKTSLQSPVTAIDLNSDWKINPGQDTVDWVHPNLNGVLKIANKFYEALVPALDKMQAVKIPITTKKIVKKTNIATGKSVSADSANENAAKAVDGDPFTLWSAADAKEHWLQIDLETERKISSTSIMWDSAGAAYGYRIEVSKDGLEWKTVVDKSQNPTELSVALEGQQDIFAPITARYLRIVVTSVPNESWTKYPVAIREVEVYE